MLDVPPARRDNRSIVQIELVIERKIFEPLQQYHRLAAARAAAHDAVLVGGARYDRVLIGLDGRDYVGKALVAALFFQHVREELVVYNAAALLGIILKYRRELAVAYIELAPENHLVPITAVLYFAVLEPVVYAVAERRIVRVYYYPVFVEHDVRADVDIRIVERLGVELELARFYHRRRVVVIARAYLPKLHAREVRRAEALPQQPRRIQPLVVTELVCAEFLDRLIVVDIDAAQLETVVFEQPYLLVHHRDDAFEVRRFLGYLLGVEIIAFRKYHKYHCSIKPHRKQELSMRYFFGKPLGA